MPASTSRVFPNNKLDPKPMQVEAFVSFLLVQRACLCNCGTLILSMLVEIGAARGELRALLVLDSATVSTT